MQYAGLDAFLKTGKSALAKGPVAMIFVEDLVEVESTLHHHMKLGFASLIVFAPPGYELPASLQDSLHHVTYDITESAAVETAVTAISQAAPGLWMYYCYNAEYLFFPFCESRTVGELLAFHTEERRDAMLTYVIDLYADDLGKYPQAVSLEDAHMDKSGYYATGRKSVGDQLHDRQLDFCGGLRWRFEEHIAPERRKIDRIALFRAKKGLTLRTNHTFSDEEYNTYACPWHNNLTAAIVSFRTAKALKTNAGSTHQIGSFMWPNSVRFDWSSQQLLDLGLMEPGQWF